MREDIRKLIENMSIQEKPPVSSSESVSWRAHREAELLCDPALVDEIAGYLGSCPTKNHRRSAYFILRKLGKRVRSFDCVSILFSWSRRETDKYVLYDLLNALADLEIPPGTDLSSVFEHMADKRHLVRHSAIMALRKTDSTLAEDRILSLLQTTSDSDDLISCHSTLGDIGTSKAIPLIEANLKSRKRDVKISAEFAIQKINERRKPSTHVAVGANA
jgi:HEAT repeat protein